MEQKRRPVVAPPAPPKATGARVKIGFVRSADAVFRGLSPAKRRALLGKIKAHVLNPNLGKPLVGELVGCCRVTLGRIRCIVRLAEGVAVGLVIAVGQRKEGSCNDPYVLALNYVNSNADEAEEILGRHVRAFLEETVRRNKPPTA